MKSVVKEERAPRQRPPFIPHTMLPRIITIQALCVFCSQTSPVPTDPGAAEVIIRAGEPVKMCAKSVTNWTLQRCPKVSTPCKTLPIISVRSGRVLCLNGCFRNGVQKRTTEGGCVTITQLLPEEEAQYTIRRDPSQELVATMNVTITDTPLFSTHPPSSTSSSGSRRSHWGILASMILLVLLMCCFYVWKRRRSPRRCLPPEADH